MWNMKRFVTPVTTGTTGILTIKTKNGNNTREAFAKLSTKKKTAVLGTSHIIRKVSQSET